MVELALLMPWLFFMFVGALDFGFYSYALIAVQNAARVAALKTGAVYDNYYQASSNPSVVEAFACRDVRDELLKLPNFSSLPADCSGYPLDVNVQPFQDADGKPALRVTVGYDTITLIPIPGLLRKELRVTRAANIRVYGRP